MKMIACKNGDSFSSNFFNQPWIIHCHGGNKDTITFIDPMAANVEETKIDQIKEKLCFSCIDEWLFLWDKQSKEVFFLELNSLSKVHLPPLPTEYNIMTTTFSFSSSPNHSDCTVIFAGAKFDHETNETEHFLMCCQLHDEKWTKLLLDENDQHIIGKTCVILDGKLYAYSIDHVIVFDVLSLLEGRKDSKTIMGPILAIYPRIDMVSMHLVKSCGHIYLVRMYKSYGIGSIINMDIYRLDNSSDKWLMVDSIGERAFFLSDTCYTSICAINVGVSCNCIYYVPQYVRDIGRIYKFCLDDHTMTFSLVSIYQMRHQSRFCWFVPRRPQKMITKSSASPTIVMNEYRNYEVLTEEKITSNISRPWDNLPIDLLELLLPHVSLVDSVRLFAVCKAWSLTSDSIQMAKTWPWLMYQEKLNGMYKLLDPSNGKEYTTKIELPSSAFPTQMLCSKDGWVIVLGTDHAMFMVNPMIQHVIKLPTLEVISEDFHGITFTSVSTSLDCVVMGICTDRIYFSIQIHAWHFGEEEWTVLYDGQIPFLIANKNPVLLHGQLYCMGETGELRVFDLVKKTWVMVDNPDTVYLEDEDESYIRGIIDCFLLELDGEVVSVFKYNYMYHEICVFKLDRLIMEWIEVEDLTGWTLLLDPRSSFAKPSPHKSWSNKIFFTAIWSGTTKMCASYCMKNKRSEMNFCDMKKPLDCVWLEPNLITKSLMMNPS